MDFAALNKMLSTPLMMPGSVAGALAALFLVLLLLSLKRAGPGMLRLMMGFVALAVFAAAVIVLIDRMAAEQSATERRAILSRNAELTARAIAPGSMLGCLDGGAGEAVENACEMAVFETPASSAGAVAYMGARLTLLKDAAEFSGGTDPALRAAFASVRRSVELDRYGIAAHVLADRDGCTAEHCPAFALLHDTEALKANMRVRAFDTYVARYADAWNKAEPKSAPVASAAPAAALASVPGPAHEPVSDKYDFPSADSIPPVSIMNAEPLLPKQDAAPASENAAPAAKLPVPPKRPQKQAAEPPAR